MTPRMSRRSQSNLSTVQKQEKRGVPSFTADVMTMEVAEPGKQVIGSSWAFGATQRIATYYTRISTSCFKAGFSLDVFDR